MKDVRLFGIYVDSNLRIIRANSSQSGQIYIIADQLGLSRHNLCSLRQLKLFGANLGQWEPTWTNSNHGFSGPIKAILGQSG